MPVSRPRRRVSRKRFRRLLAQNLESRRLLAAGPVISELLASNAGGLEDEDGDSPDWVEVYNPSNDDLDLTGYRLTDDVDELSKWTFPATVLAPTESLVVFASGKDRAVAGSTLHTNFELDKGGEYLALVDPSGTIVSQYSPEFPDQTTNVSYGLQYETQLLVESGDAAKFLVPTDGSLGETWEQAAFDDSSWDDANLGVGFGVIDPGFDVRYVKARSSGSFNGNVTNLGIAETVLATPEYQSFSVTERRPVINFLGTGGGGRFGNDLAFPTQSIGEDINHFVIEATSTIHIPSAGFWSFGVNSDDGFGLTLSRNGNDYSSSFPNPRGASDTIATFDLLEAGDYDVRLVMFEAGGGASVEFFSAPGSHSSFSGVFDLVGDVDSGAPAAFAPYIPGQSTWVTTDIESSLSGVNSSAYLRVPFEVTDASSLESLTLRMRYDDGFVASINGVEIASRNAPASPTFDSAATTKRDANDVIAPIDLVLDATAQAAIVDGVNVLAIQGMNHSSSDDSFLVSPELLATRLVQPDPTYFATPTPGEVNRDPVEGVLGRVAIDIPAGFYDTPQTVTLLSPDVGAQIVYTTDGSEPSADNGTVYSGPLTIDRTTTLRAIAVADGYFALPSVTRSYLFLDDVLTQSPDGSPPPGWPSSWGNNVVDYGIDPDVIASEGAANVKDALLALPTLSLTTDLDHLFDSATGIYANAQQDGRDWERPASAEWLNPDGSDGFQINAGLRIRGGFSRSGNNPKHALKLFFRGSYGDSTLNYPVHGDIGVSEFKKLDLRTAQNYSWSFQGNSSNNFIAEVFARYNQRDLGQPYTRSTWVHLYLNGQYWGMYQTQERAEANYAASYFGGDAEDYDVLKPERGAYQNIATDGNFDAYTLLWEQAVARAPDGVTPAFVDDAAYLRAQGKNPDGTDNLDYPVLLDVDNLIAYMVETFRGGNLDAPISNFLGNNRPNNYFAIRHRDRREGFRFFQHDAEHTMRNLNQNRNGPWNSTNYDSTVLYFNPQWLHQQLMANEEYRMRFADTVQYAFFNDGPLSESVLIDKLNLEASRIETAVIAESARWGDAKRNENQAPFGQANFLNAIAGLRNNYLPNRNPIVIEQFRNTVLRIKGPTDEPDEFSVVVPAPLFPSIDAPRFIVNGFPQHGGPIQSFSKLQFDAPGSNLVYYMTDGSDPRLVGGGIHPDAMIYTPSVTTETLISQGDSWSYDDTGIDLGTSWRDTFYPDSFWPIGNAELGYGDGDEATVVSFGGNASDKQPTTYFRKAFTIQSPDVQAVRLRLKVDDGAVVYLNGNEVARYNMPAGEPTYNTFAAGVVPNDGNNWQEFTIAPGLLNFGDNTLAVEVHQVSATSSDISFDAELTAETPDEFPIILNDNTRLSARGRTAGGEWSALSEALFQIPNVPASPDNVRLTEVNYNPVADGDAEYLEIRNISSGAQSVVVDLDGVMITDGPSLPYTVPNGTRLLPGESVLVVHDVAAFAAAYPGVDPNALVGQYSGKLSNGGERIRVVDSTGALIADLSYGDNDPWPEWSDGDGGSLVLIDPANVPVSETGKPYHYRDSVELGGTPGASESMPSGILINEVLAHTDDPLSDSIEFYNPTGEAIDIGGWFVSDSGDNREKFRFPVGTTIAAGAYLVIDESQFNPPAPTTQSLVPFALSSSNGDSVWLFSGDGTAATGLQDHARFDATFNGVSLGLIEGSAGRLVPLANRSLGTLNGTFVNSAVYVSEFNYHPAPPSAAALAVDSTLTSGDLEFIELTNDSSLTVDLENWRLRGEGDFDFVEGQSIAGGESLIVVSFDPDSPISVNRLAAFRAHYGIDAGVRIEGPFSGGLSNSHGLIKLQAPDQPPLEDPLLIPRVTVDEVFYDDLDPWAIEADGNGPSLQRLASSALGNYFDSWRAVSPTPGDDLDRPQVEAFQVNDGALSRSNLTKVSVRFDQEVNLSVDSFRIVQRGSGTEVTDLQVSSSVSDGKTTAEITFGSGLLVIDRGLGNSLVDGGYELTVLGDQVTSVVGDVPMASNLTFGEAAADRFFRFYGDEDGDRDTDGQDYLRFAETFLRRSGDPNYNAEFDEDGDGDVDGVDYAVFGTQFLRTLDH